MPVNKFLIKNPIITEKATDLSKMGKYVFLVEKSATAPEIKKALKVIYKVDAMKVHMINTRPKPKQWMQRKLFNTLQAGYKKAIVTLKTGQKLDILPQ
ncbi:MAG: 50S ribosomal protein L23 [Candidatus Harrisonbacteria bacterium RIFCSPLOWO2_02_FULL_41_13b]|uniref:Large ribosomal subunit protein uL23 n=1 Tax=Candidatus Harrisonbacteria bacterium RIFCSPLOWO2_02_FULL_41_13b TaxID=1798409 RepID=A0A1G1ZQG9_9BACT|nr:MAG: 50S ribosomal protein L23 [Candidatus Harrisonbacteria bacterium RIFCSPHIGHO2_02_FULL_40_20]OGY66699.1 MAG: 50S ribosomal protein L23 [Candidatus Harrisonbacteria bacterium RIFCSPLOWO2_02_FULL_41_13b]